MLKKFRKILIVGLISILNFGLLFADVSLSIPDGTWQNDINVPQSRISANEGDIFDIIGIINDYLWFSIAGLCMALLIYAGIKFMTAGGDKGKISSAGKIAGYCLIGIVIAIFSYAIVKLVINLF